MLLNTGKRGAKIPRGNLPASGFLRLFLLALHGVVGRSKMYDGFIQRFSSTAASDGSGSVLSSCQSENREGSLPRHLRWLQKNSSSASCSWPDFRAVMVTQSCPGVSGPDHILDLWWIRRAGSWKKIWGNFPILPVLTRENPSGSARHLPEDVLNHEKEGENPLSLSVFPGQS